MPPCQASCPSGIPVQKRWQLIREGRLAEAVDLSLEYALPGYGLRLQVLKR